ncbi:MAG: hypothetical protein LBM92_00080, partial [Opitutaceae bacterium]|nr:hypothetical protein [Opitutaceae bacterium]
MKPCFLCLVARAAVLVCAWCAADVLAQWHAPETNYHDPVQRVFPVELARVLAWRENAAGGAGISEVTYELNCAEDGAAEWTLRWLDGSGGVWREARVGYRAALLAGGPDFYRNVARQLRAQPWAAFAKTSEARLEEAFWGGLGQMQVSRMAGVREAMRDGGALRENPLDAGAAARVAGGLLAATVPSVGGMFTLDSTLAARGAAWLALAEEAAGESTLAGDLRWAVVLKLAQREDQAMRLELNVRAGEGPGGGAAGALPESAREAREWWQFVTGPNERRAMLLQAAHHESAAKGAALLGHAVRLGEKGSLLPEAAQLLYGRDSEFSPELLELHDYTWLTTDRQARHWAVFLWADAARADWLRTMRQIPDAERRQIEGLDEAIKEALLPPKLDSAMIKERGRKAVRATGEDFDARNMLDQVLPGFRKSAPLIQLGRWAGGGKLEPVAVASARDLLGFGWEMCGMQLRSQLRMIPFAPARSALRDKILEHTPELEVFFGDGRRSQEIRGAEHLDRLQRVDLMAETLLFARTVADRNYKDRRTKTKMEDAHAREMGRRGWLMPHHMECVATASTYSAGKTALAAEFFERAHAEGGPVLDRKLLVSLMSREASAKRMLGDKFDEVARLLAANVDGGDVLLARNAKAREAAERSKAAREAREAAKEGGAETRQPGGGHELQMMKGLEDTFWKEPTALAAIRFVAFCIESNATEPARRFFGEAWPLLEDDAGRKTLLFMMTALALVENDLDGVRRFLPLFDRKDTHPKLVFMFLLALADQDERDARQVAAGAVEADAKGSKNLDEYISLWRNLRKPGTPEYRSAFERLSSSSGWPLFQWIIARQTDMDTETLIAFLGGERAQGANRMLVNCLRKQKKDYRDALRTEGGRIEATVRVLIWHVAAREFEKPKISNADLPSLRPENPPQPVRRALLAEREKWVEERFGRECAGLRTADEWWAFYQDWRARNRVGAGHEGEASALALERQAVLLRMFSKRHPGDARVWDARLALARSGRLEGAVGNSAANE